MATLGRPSVNTPRELTLREVQQVVANIAARLLALDSTVTTLQSNQQGLADAAVVDLKAIRRDIVTLKQAIVALQAQIDALDLGGAAEDAARVEQLAGELVVLRALLDDPIPDPRLEQLVGEVAALRNQADDPPSDPRVEQLAGELQSAQRRIAQVDEAPDRLPQLEALVAELSRQVAELDTVGQTPAHATLLQQLQRQIDDINEGVLL